MRKLLTLAFVMTFVQALGLGSPFTTTQAHAAAALAPARPQQAPAAEEETRAEVEEALQELEARAEESGRPFVPVPRVSFFEQAPDRTYTDEEKAYLREMIQFENVSINGRDISSDRLAEAIIRVVQNPTAFNQALNEWIPRLTILFVPFLAILGTVVIRGRDAMIYDHLLISIQTHAFAFLIVTFSLWTNWILPPALAGWAFFAAWTAVSRSFVVPRRTCA